MEMAVEMTTSHLDHGRLYVTKSRKCSRGNQVELVELHNDMLDGVKLVTATT
jgi:hypothetical protein